MGQYSWLPDQAHRISPLAIRPTGNKLRPESANGLQPMALGWVVMHGAPPPPAKPAEKVSANRECGS